MKVLFGLMVLAMLLVLAFELGRGSVSPVDKFTAVSTWQAELADNRDQIDSLKTDTRAQLGVLAVRLGRLDARVRRLDALAGQLTANAGLAYATYQFHDVPGVGGTGGTGMPYDLMALETAFSELEQRLYRREKQLEILNRSLTEQAQSRDRKLESGIGRIVEGFISSPFGLRTDPLTGDRRAHNGIDIASPTGEEIYAAAAGIVVVSDSRGGFGKTIEIDHGDGYLTRYAHCSRLLVSPGALVKKGQLIALVGSTGRSTGSHLHFEVRKDGVPVDPAGLLQLARDDHAQSVSG